MKAFDRRFLISLLLLPIAFAGAALNEDAPPRSPRTDGKVEGRLSLPRKPGQRPGLLIVSEQDIDSETSRRRASQFSDAGYVAFTIQTKRGEERGKDQAVSRAAARDQASRALATLAGHPRVDPTQLAAIGYGMGGAAVLDLARAGTDILGVAVVHGDLSTSDSKRVKARVLIVTGTDDPPSAVETLGKFEEEMRSGGVDWIVVRLGGASGDFTSSEPEVDGKKRRTFDPSADRRANAAVRVFLSDLFIASRTPSTTPAAPPAMGAPEKVLKVLKQVDAKGKPFEGYEGGRTFLNLERRLPRQDARGRNVQYKEWDVNPLKPGVNRGPERLVTGSDGSAYFTQDHYRTFRKIR